MSRLIRYLLSPPSSAPSFVCHAKALPKWRVCRRSFCCSAGRLKIAQTQGQSACGIADSGRPSRLPRLVDGWPTIYALSTAAGQAAIAIIRVSGPACKEIYHALCPSTRLPRPRYASIRSLHDPSLVLSHRALLDPSALILYFPAPKTVTGEDVVEFHVHGGPAVVKAVLAAIGKFSTPENPVQYAEPGEFTRRAFLNDRLDLPQIEALGDVLSAVTEEQRRVATRGSVSGLADRYESWRRMLLDARGELEALIDFSEDQHFDESPTALAASVAKQIESLRRSINLHCSNSMRGELLRNGISLSLLGAPNVGKSSLLNQVVGRNAAIVSTQAGTTRDVVEVGIDIGGFFCRLGDTAGLRRAQAPRSDVDGHETVGEVEQEGIRRAKARATESDVVILMFSIEHAPHQQGVQIHLENEVLETAAQLSSTGKNVVAVVNKMDRYGDRRLEMAEKLTPSILSMLPGLQPEDIFWTSCKDAESSSAEPIQGGVRNLTNGLITKFKNMTSALTLDDDDSTSVIWQESLGATERQRSLLETCKAQLDAFIELAQPKVSANSEDSDAEVDIVAAAEHLRSAADCLARITGRGTVGDVEEVLGVVFEKFCVGK